MENIAETVDAHQSMDPVVSVELDKSVQLSENVFHSHVPQTVKTEPNVETMDVEDHVEHVDLVMLVLLILKNVDMLLHVTISVHFVEVESMETLDVLVNSFVELIVLAINSVTL